MCLTLGPHGPWQCDERATCTRVAWAPSESGSVSLSARGGVGVWLLFARSACPYFGVMGSASDDGGPSGPRPEGPAVAVFRSGRVGPADRGTGKTSVVPAQERAEHAENAASARRSTSSASEPPARDVVADALLHDLRQKLLAVDELHGALASTTYYGLLGLHTRATPREIREAYFTSVRCFHPATFFGRDLGAHQKRVESVFGALTQAYETLRRPASRALYDDSLSLGASARYGPGLESPEGQTAGDPERTEAAVEAGRVSQSLAPAAHSRPPVAPPSQRASMAPRPSLQQSRPSLAPRPSLQQSRPSLAPQAPAPVRPSMAPRPSMAARSPSVVDTRPMSLPRERASAAARAERDFFVDDGATHNTQTRNSLSAPGAGSGRKSFPPEAGSGSTHNPFSEPAGRFEEEVRRSSTLLRELDQLAQKRLQETGDESGAATLSLLDIASRVRGGGGVSKWAAARLQEAHQAEQAGRLGDAAQLVRSVHGQLRDPYIEAHVHRLARMLALKG